MLPVDIGSRYSRRAIGYLARAIQAHPLVEILRPHPIHGSVDARNAVGSPPSFGALVLLHRMCTSVEHEHWGQLIELQHPRSPHAVFDVSVAPKGSALASRSSVPVFPEVIRGIQAEAQLASTPEGSLHSSEV